MTKCRKNLSGGYRCSRSSQQGGYCWQHGGNGDQEIGVSTPKFVYQTGLPTVYHRFNAMQYSKDDIAREYLKYEPGKRDWVNNRATKKKLIDAWLRLFNIDPTEQEWDKPYILSSVYPTKMITKNLGGQLVSLGACHPFTNKKYNEVDPKNCYKKQGKFLLIFTYLGQNKTYIVDSMNTTKTLQELFIMPMNQIITLLAYAEEKQKQEIQEAMENAAARSFTLFPKGEVSSYSRFKLDRNGLPELNQLNYTDHFLKIFKDKNGRSYQVLAYRKNNGNPSYAKSNLMISSAGKVKLKWEIYSPPDVSVKLPSRKVSMIGEDQEYEWPARKMAVPGRNTLTEARDTVLYQPGSRAQRAQMYEDMFCANVSDSHNLTELRRVANVLQIPGGQTMTKGEICKELTNIFSYSYPDN